MLVVFVSSIYDILNLFRGNSENSRLKYKISWVHGLIMSLVLTDNYLIDV